MNAPLILLHEEALRMSHPVFAAAPQGTRSIFVWDDTYFQQLPHSLKRLIFIYETLCEMPIDIVHATPLDAVQHFAPSMLYIPTTHSPPLVRMIDALRAHVPITLVTDEPFVTLNKPTDARRFFQYWKKAEKTAFLHNGGAHA